MSSIRIRTHVDSENLHIPELRSFVGQDVEITIQSSPLSEQQWHEIRSKLNGSIVKDDDPFGPAVPPEDWEAVA